MPIGPLILLLGGYHFENQSLRNEQNWSLWAKFDSSTYFDFIILVAWKKKSVVFIK